MGPALCSRLAPPSWATLYGLITGAWARVGPRPFGEHFAFRLLSLTAKVGRDTLPGEGSGERREGPCAGQRGRHTPRPAPCPVSPRETAFPRLVKSQTTWANQLPNRFPVRSLVEVGSGCWVPASCLPIQAPRFAASPWPPTFRNLPG